LAMAVRSRTPDAGRLIRRESGTAAKTELGLQLARIMDGALTFRARSTPCKSPDVLQRAGFQGISEQFLELRRPKYERTAGNAQPISVLVALFDSVTPQS
jgi:hypothetical protein